MSVYELREDGYKPGVYLYDYRKDTGGEEDALGSDSDGLVKIGKTLDVVVKAEDGGIYEIEVKNGVLTITDRTSGFGRMMIAPNVSNVIEIRQVNPPR